MTVKFLDGKRELKQREFNINNSARKATPHSHAFVEIVYFYKGKGTHTIGGETLTISSGDIFCINPNVVHSYTTFSENDTPIEVYNIMFSTSFLGKEFDNPNFINNYLSKTFNNKIENENTSYLFVHGDIRHNILTLYNLILNEYTINTQEKNFSSIPIIKHLLEALILKLFSVKYISNSPKLLPIGTTDLINDALDYISTNCAETLLLSDVAKKYHYTPQYFNKLLQYKTNLSFTQYLQKCRISLAAKLLEASDYTIDDICGRVGYVDLKHFYVVFKKYIGISPAKYRTYVKKQDSLNIDINK